MERVRVRLFASSPPTSASITSPLPFDVQLGDSFGDTHRLEGPIRLSTQRGRLLISGVDGVFETVTIQSDAPIQVRAGSTTRSYPGSLTAQVAGGRLELVNHVLMPDYVASVVASEYPFAEIEGIKAQAVLARTYAARRLTSTRSYDLDDHQGAQVYKGLEVVTERARQAAAETLGERLYYGDGLAEAVYSSSSGGHTADNETIWNGSPLPYLRGVPDPYDAGSPDHRWTTTARVRDVHAALSRRFGGTVRDLRVAERSPEGRIVELELAGSRTISGSEFRSAVNAALGYRTVRSTNVEISRRGGDYVFEGRGFGHGVGMSQYGAQGQAREGRSYREILAYYFQGTTVAQDPSAAPVASSTRWPTPRRDARQAEAETPTVRRRPTPRREARAADTSTRRRAW